VVEATLKVLMVVESHAKQAGGGPMYWSQLSEGLIQRGHDVMILSGTPSEEGVASPNTVGLLPVGKELRNRSLSTLIRRYLFKRRYIPLVRAFAREWKPDIIHTVPPIASDAALQAGRELDVPVVASVLSHVEAQWAYLEAGWTRARLFRFLESRALRKPYSRIITNDGVPPERLVYVPHAVDITRFHADVVPRFRQQLNLSKDAMVIGYAGALTWDKGFDQLLGAMRQLKSVVNLHLLVAGDFSGQEEWKELGQWGVHFLGRLEHQDMPAFMASLDLFIIPSYTETVPTTLLEALATGVPVMATAVGGIPEFLQNVGGILLESPETACIVRALENWRGCQAELEQLGIHGQQYVRAHHNWEQTIELTEGVYQSCLVNR
jgi:glycosyltransferase involved in cell wall biosynthesis